MTTTKPTFNPKLLAKAGFTGQVERIPRIILSVEGLDKSGKTHFACTAPGPHAYQALDFGHEGVVDKFQAQGKEILVQSLGWAIPKDIRMDDHERVAKFVRQNVLNPYVEGYRASLEAGARTVTWDTGGELWEAIRYAHFGRLEKVPAQFYAAANAEYRELIRLANVHRANLIILHQQKPEWNTIVEGGKTKSFTTGRMIASGNEKLPYLVQAKVETRFVPEKIHKRTKEIIEEAHFEVEILTCRHDPDLRGVVIPDCDFPTLMAMIMPDVDPAEWE